MIPQAESDQDYRPIEIPGLDTAPVLERMEGDVNLFHSLLRPLLSDSGQTAYLAMEDVTAGRYEQAARRLHTLRGALANIGATEICARALEIERAIRDGRYAGIVSRLEELDVMLRGQLEAVRAYLAEVASESSASALPSPAGSEGPDPRALDELIQALMTQDADALDRFEALYPALKTSVDAESAQQLRNGMDALRFSEVADLLAKVKLPE